LVPVLPPEFTAYWPLNAESGSRVPPQALSRTTAANAEVLLMIRRWRVNEPIGWEDFTKVPPQDRGGRVGRLLHACQGLSVAHY
jgi:hypothetical protein